jgi:DnaJ-related protein SCJ1
MKLAFLLTGLFTILFKILCEKDLYKVFEIQRSASQIDIKKKYRELTRKFHPDRNQGNKEASEKFSEVAEAYEILSDPRKRRLYDRGGMDAVKNEGQMQESFDPSDMFGGMFGGGQRGERRDNDLKIKLRVTLKDLYLGKEYEVIFIFYY